MAITSALRLAAVPLVLAATATLTATAPATAAPATAAPATAAPAAAPADRAVAGISGWARMDYPVADEDIRIFVDAHGLFTPHDQGVAASSWGTFRIQHWWPPKGDGQPSFNWGDFKVDCVSVNGPDVAVTGRIVDAGPYWQEFLHRKQPARMGLSFHVPADGGGPTRIGLTAPTADGQPELPKCSAKSPDANAIEGGYTVLDTRR
ncbi:hypothetical protein OG974_31080 (plasmid) [Streptomyces sp. NBC_00597]|uniref:hypothetical protein n=1 Tax=Streptomyces sp. NBC_00597 TaxID=2975786 RepID=UPI002F90CF6C